MSVHKQVGVIGSLELTRGVGSLFIVDVVYPNNERVPVGGSVSAETAHYPMLELVQQQLVTSPKAQVGRDGRVGWRRRSDAIAAVTAAVRLLGEPAPATTTKTEPVVSTSPDVGGVKVWFSDEQLRALQRIVALGVEALPAREAESNLVTAVVDRVDCAVRHVLSLRRRRG